MGKYRFLIRRLDNVEKARIVWPDLDLNWIMSVINIESAKCYEKIAENSEKHIVCSTP